MNRIWTRWKWTPPRAVRLSLWCSLAVLALLQIWSPFYFLTGDNLCGLMPVVVDVGRSLTLGQLPFINTHLYGGQYHLLNDPANLCLWHPLMLALSLLGQTRAFAAILDLYVSLNLLLCAGAFSLLLCRLRETQHTALTDSRIVFLTLSFTFSAFTLIVDASGATFAANQSALPIIMLGLLHPQRRTGILLVSVAILHALLGGHLGPFLYALLFFTAFIGVHGMLTRQSEPLMRWLCAGFLAIVVSSPLLLPALQGFVGTTRNAALPTKFTSILSIPLPVFVASFFGGSMSVLLPPLPPPTIPNGLYHIVCCAAAFTVFHSWGARRKQSPLEWATLSMALLLVLFIVRPPWLAELLSHIPIYRSLRVPMREVLLFMFFLHIWIALRPIAISLKAQRLTMVAGVAVLVMSMSQMGPPSSSDMELDRRLVISGAAERYWKTLQPEFQPPHQLIPAKNMSTTYLDENVDDVPWTLFGAYNYPALYGVTSRSGYSIPGLSAASLEGIKPLGTTGVIDLEEALRYQKRHPEVKILCLMSIHPPRIDLIDGEQRRTLPLPAVQR